MGRGNQGTEAVNRHSLGGQLEFEQAETGKVGGIGETSAKVRNFPYRCLKSSLAA
jgi:hypothetical protein